MRRERKEIINKMNIVNDAEAAEYEMSCGFATNRISDAFAPLQEKLQEKLAATYGKTVKEYDEMCYRIQHTLYLEGKIPFIG